MDYKGITVAEDSALRRELRKNGVEYNVVKNTLMRFAVDKVGFDGLDPSCRVRPLWPQRGDPIAPVRILSEYAKKLTGNSRSGGLHGRSDPQHGGVLRNRRPARQRALYAKVLGTMLAPITSLAVCLGQILEQKGGTAADAAAE